MSEINFNTYIDPNAIEEKSIEKKHLADAVQTSLDKADVAVSAITINGVTKTDVNPEFTGLTDVITFNGKDYTPNSAGTVDLGSAVTGVTMNNQALTVTNGSVDLGTVITGLTAATTAVSGIVKLSSSTDSDAENLAATPKAVKEAYDLADGKQDALSSGTNIKTINNTSLLGSGDIEIKFEQVQSDWNETNASNKAYIKNKPNLADVATSGLYGDLSDTPNLAKVATSGLYSDLSGKPTIPAEVTESTVTGWGFTKNKGTITEIKMNGISKGTNGAIDLGTVVTDLTTASTSTHGITKLSSSVSSTAEDIAATSKAVKDAYDLASNLRSDLNLLVSGNTDETINNFREIVDFLEDFNTGDTLASALETVERYKSVLDKDLTMVNAVGGIEAGTKVSDLSGRTITSILDDLLFPTLIPLSTDHTNPSVSNFTLSDTTSPIIINSALRTISTDGSLNRGKWTKYDSTINYAGAETTRAYTFTINDTAYTGNTINAVTSSSGYPTKYTKPGNHTYKITINYGEGPAPKDSKGNLVDSLAAPATAVTATRTINVTYPWFATTATAGTLTQQTSLIKWTTDDMSTGEFELKPHTTATPQMFSLPRTAKSIELYDTSTQTWKSDTVSTWHYASGTKTINGMANCTYHTYTYCETEKRGSVKIRVKF